MGRLASFGGGLQSALAGLEFTAITTNAPAIETTIKRSGVAAYRISNASAAEGFRHQYTSSQGVYYLQFHIHVVTLPTGTISIGGFRITGAYKLSIRITPAGLLQLFNNEDTIQIGANSSALSTGAFYRLAMGIDTTTLSATAVEARAYVDTPGASNFWNPSGTADLAANPNNIGIGITGGDATLDYVVDDIGINDNTGSRQNSWPGEEKLIYQLVNGNGDSSQWTGSDGNSTDNYLLLDEVPPDTADYVQSNTSGQADYYNMEATPAELGASDTINFVQVGIYAAVSDATSSDPDVVIGIKDDTGGTIEESAALDVNAVTFQGPVPLPALGNYALTLYDLPGASTSPWTKAKLDTMQVGIREAVTDAHFVRVASIWAIVSFTPSTSHTITVNQISETDTAQAINRSKAKAIGQNTETDSAQAISRTKNRAIGQNLETDLAQAIGRRKVVTVNQVTEAEIAQPITRLITETVVAVGQISEADSAQVITRTKVKALGMIGETDTAQAITRVKIKAIGQVSETDLAQAVQWSPKHRAISLATETDSSQSISRIKNKTIGQVIEADLARAVQWSPKHRTVSQVAEADSAQAMTHAKRKAVAQATEADAAQVIAWKITRLVTQVAEMDAAQAITVVTGGEVFISIGQVTEVNTAQSIGHVKSRSISQVTENDTAQPVSRIKILIVSQVAETDLAQSLFKFKRVSVVQVAEIDISQAIAHAKRRAVGQATETDLAQLVGRIKARSILQASEIDLAHSISQFMEKVIVMGLAVEVDSALALSLGERVIRRSVHIQRTQRRAEYLTDDHRVDSTQKRKANEL
jgi:hypothetical protein